LDKISVFVSSDIRDLTPGNRWLTTIEEELKECTVLIVICSQSSLTRPWINFEAGCGWVKGIPLIPLCHSGQKKDQLPFPFIQYQGIQLEDENSGLLLAQTLSKYFKSISPHVRKGVLAKSIDKVKPNMIASEALPFIIKSTKERTKLITDDLQTLFSSEDVNKEIVWSSSFLSAFAISKDDVVTAEKQENHRLLLLENELLCNLARKGCTIKCIISPASSNFIRHVSVDYAIDRTETLVNFLTSDDVILDNIEFVIAELGSKNLYIIGNMSCFEGYKNGLDQGYGLTLKQTSTEVIKANIDVYGAYFDDLSARTISKWKGSHIEGINRKAILRNSVISCLYESIDFLNCIKANQVNNVENRELNLSADIEDNIC
jgi:hypothetical protein